MSLEKQYHLADYIHHVSISNYLKLISYHKHDVAVFFQSTFDSLASLIVKHSVAVFYIKPLRAPFMDNLKN